jgi:hypothetical protein
MDYETVFGMDRLTGRGAGIGGPEIEGDIEYGRAASCEPGIPVVWSQNRRRAGMCGGVVDQKQAHGTEAVGSSRFSIRIGRDGQLFPIAREACAPLHVEDSHTVRSNDPRRWMPVKRVNGKRKKGEPGGQSERKCAAYPSKSIHHA